MHLKSARLQPTAMLQIRSKMTIAVLEKKGHNTKCDR